MNLQIKSFGIEAKEFTLLPQYFDTQSLLHGINHTYRVMYHCLELGEVLQCRKASKLAFMGAYIHDMARQHDGYCTEHGSWASIRKLPLFRGLFLAAGASEEDLKLISTAVYQHSLPIDLSTSDHAWQVSALLKDADALDRIRLGENNLMSEFLRFRESILLIEPAKELFYKCPFEPLSSLGELFALKG